MILHAKISEARANHKTHIRLSASWISSGETPSPNTVDVFHSALLATHFHLLGAALVRQDDAAAALAVFAAAGESQCCKTTAPCSFNEQPENGYGRSHC